MKLLLPFGATIATENGMNNDEQDTRISKSRTGRKPRITEALDEARGKGIEIRGMILRCNNSVF